MNRKLEFEYSEIQEDVMFNWPEGIRYKIWRKGRRSGGTKGPANGICETMTTNPGISVLWGDTIVDNIKKYVERYVEPCLKKNKIKYTWYSQEKKLLIGDSFCDFRSSDNPETWEGFGYDLIFLNEAGIILKTPGLYTRSVLPMLIDNPKSRLIAAGVPKGKKLKTGEEHLFYTLYKRALENPDKYMTYITSTYDSPFIDLESARQLEEEMFSLGGASLVAQEIYGEFVDRKATDPFVIHYNEARHLAPVELDINKQLFLSIDFNLRPFGLIAAHIWRDSKGWHYHRVDEMKIQQGSIPAMIDEIKLRYYPWIPTMKLTGDAMGKRGDLSQRDNSSYYMQLETGLGLSRSQLVIPANPTHENSKEDVNYVFYYHPDNKINPAKCSGLIFDIENVEVDAEGKILKHNRKVESQRADLMDCERYMINAFLPDFIKAHRKGKQ